MYSVAVLAVANSPEALLSPNPARPLLYTFTVSLQWPYEDPDEAAAAVRDAAGTQVQQRLPAGYCVSLVAVYPIPHAAIAREMAMQIATQPLSNDPYPAGKTYFDDVYEEATINTYRPGIAGHNKSPRYALRCPYCGNLRLRLSGDVKTRTPDGFRADVRMGAEDAQEGHTDESPRFVGGRGFGLDALTFAGMDTERDAPFKGHPGVSIGATCPNGHTCNFWFLEDEAENGPNHRDSSGPALFCVLEYTEPPEAFVQSTLNPNAPGTGIYPPRP